MQIGSTTLRAALGVLAMAWPVVWPAMRAASAQETPSTQQIWTVPEIGALPNNAYGRLVRRGRDLITASYAHIGPEVADRAKRFEVHPLGWTGRGPENRLTDPGFRGESPWLSTARIRSNSSDWSSRSSWVESRPTRSPSATASAATCSGSGARRG